MDRKRTIVVVAGTGTEVGKTHIAASLLRVWGERRPVLGYKPVETGVPRGSRVTGDAGELAKASTFHVKHPPYRQTFLDPISPHLAARREGVAIDVGRLARQARDLADEPGLGIVVELAGGLFTPLGAGQVNADLARRIRPTRLVVGRDR